MCKAGAENASAKGYDRYFNLQSSTDANGNATFYGWDDSGCVCNLDIITDALGMTITLEYDQYSNVTQVMDNQGNTTSYEYDDHKH